MQVNLRVGAGETGILEPIQAPVIDGAGDVPQFPGLIGAFMGRDALTLAVSYLDLTEHDTVLLPIYTCQDVLKSFVRKCNVVFYDIGHDLTIDPGELRTKMEKAGRVRLVLITNYFGFLQPYRREIKEICATRDIALIEDCAHSLLTDGSGDTGDFSAYSFRKILPLRDGGGLRVAGAVKSSPPHYRRRIYSDVLSCLAFGKSLLNIRTDRFSRARVASQAAHVLPLPSNGDHILPLSYFARHRMANISLSDVVRRRRNDFQFWLETTRENRAVTPIFDVLPVGVCPFGFALRAKNRDYLENRASEEGIYLRVHWRLDGTVGSDCSTSHELSKEILTLPLYPELRPRERNILAHLVSH